MSGFRPAPFVRSSICFPPPQSWVFRTTCLAERTGFASLLMYASVFLRRIGLITDVQVNTFNLVFFVVPSGRWKIFCDGSVAVVVTSSGFCCDEFFRAFAVMSDEEVSKLSLLLLRILVVPRGRMILVIAVRVQSVWRESP